MAAGLIAVTSIQFNDPNRRYAFAWTSDASGNVNGNTTNGAGVITGSPGRITGLLLRVVFIPGTGGVQPSDAYDMVMLDSNGFDILAGLGANLSQTNTTSKVPGNAMTDGTTVSTAPIALNDILELQVSNAGNAKQGTVVLYVR